MGAPYRDWLQFLRYSRRLNEEAFESPVVLVPVLCWCQFCAGIGTRTGNGTSMLVKGLQLIKAVPAAAVRDILQFWARGLDQPQLAVVLPRARRV